MARGRLSGAGGAGGDNFVTANEFSPQTLTTQTLGTTILDITGKGWLVSLYNTYTSSRYFKVTIDGAQVIPEDTAKVISISADKQQLMLYRFEVSLKIETSGSSTYAHYKLD